MKNIKKQSLLGIIVFMALFLVAGTTSMVAQSVSCTPWDLSSNGNWQLKEGSIDYNAKGITFIADNRNRCNPSSKTTHAVNSKSVIYYKVKADKANLSIRDAKISIFIPNYSLNGEEGTLMIKQLRGYELGKDKSGFTWIAFDLSKLGADAKKQGVYTYEFQVKGKPKVLYTSEDDDTKIYNKILKDLKKNEYKGNRFDFILISKLDKDQGNESFTMEELGNAESIGEVKAKINK
ncbi:hypothetical protein [Bacteroides acidifaciens]|uniref:hypothetical protein n=1 Tax=Bacteroides acidifaciens TaxID=85831 RepID=UPI00158C2263|nr:hypothetical protein [Bacteroides acidifaciens]